MTYLAVKTKANPHQHNYLNREGMKTITYSGTYPGWEVEIKGNALGNSSGWDIQFN